MATKKPNSRVAAKSATKKKSRPALRSVTPLRTSTGRAKSAKSKKISSAAHTALKIESVRSEIREQIIKLKEIYSSARLLLAARIPNFAEIMEEIIVDPGQGAEVVTVEDILEHVEHKLDELLATEKRLTDLHQSAAS